MSHTIDYLSDFCSCGRKIGAQSHLVALMAAADNTPTGFTALANRMKLKSCCRMTILAPLRVSVVSADQSALYVESPDASMDMARSIRHGSPPAPRAYKLMSIDLPPL